MDIKTAEGFRFFVERKLRVEKVDINNREKSIKTLERCVLGGRLVKAYLVLFTSAP